MSLVTLNRLRIPCGWRRVQQQQEAEEQLLKKQKTEESFTAVLANAKSKEAEGEYTKAKQEYEKAQLELLGAARRFMGDCPHNPKAHRYPQNTAGTWNREAIGLGLKNIRNNILPRAVPAYSCYNREAVVIGMRLGTGCGKTHILTMAHELLGISSSVYITYYHDQDLQTDKQNTKKAALLRLVLASHGCSSIECASFFEDGTSARFFEASIEDLKDLAVEAFRKVARDGDLLLAAELAVLGTDLAKQVVSLLSLLCSLYYQKTKAICMVLVSSLNDAVFSTRRGIIEWVPDRVTAKTIDFFWDKLPERKRGDFSALAKSICGTHMRSIVVCFNEMNKGNKCNKPSVKTMFKSMKTHMGVTLGGAEYNAIVQRVKDCMILDGLNPACSLEIQELIDHDGVLCPFFIQLAFSEMRKESMVHLTNLFQTFAQIHADGKDFEVAVMHFDFFRASLRVPVVPRSSKIGLPQISLGFSTDWYRQLNFPDVMAFSDEDLLIVVPTKTNTKKKEVVASQTEPVFGRYYHPGTAGHPWIDRGFVAMHSVTGEKCLVLTQEKVNDDFSKACRALNSAAKMLSEKWKFTKILLIVNVLGLNLDMRAQQMLQWPFILICGMEEAKAFYSVNFADLIWYAHESHLLKHSNNVAMHPPDATSITALPANVEGTTSTDANQSESTPAGPLAQPSI